MPTNTNKCKIELESITFEKKECWFCGGIMIGRYNGIIFCEKHKPQNIPKEHWQEVFNH